MFSPAFYLLTYSKNGALSYEFILSFVFFNFYMYALFKFGFFVSVLRNNKFNKSNYLFCFVFLCFLCLFVYGVFYGDVYGVFMGNFGALSSFFIYMSMRRRA
jgi:hypothetical protein